MAGRWGIIPNKFCVVHRGNRNSQVPKTYTHSCTEQAVAKKNHVEACLVEEMAALRLQITAVQTLERLLLGGTDLAVTPGDQRFTGGRQNVLT